MLFVAATAHADEPQVAVTLAEAIAAASSAPLANVSRHEIEAAAALVDAAGAWPNPSLRVETHRLTALLVVGAAIPIPAYGSVDAAQRQASAQAQTVRSEMIVNNRDIRRRAVIAWIMLARADGEIAATAMAATQAAELERIARGRLDAGVGADVDVSTARAARIRADLAAAAAKRGEQAASAELAGVLGWDPMRPLVATGELPGRDSTTLDALRARLPGHPERTVARRRVVAAEATVDAVRSLRWPTFAVEGQIAVHDPETPGTDLLVALSVDLPVFARIGDRARSARAFAAAERARLAVTETQLGAGLVASYRRWQAAADMVAALEQEIVPAQERAATLSAQAYREGARDLASALQADRDLTAVRAEVIAARADLAAAWAELQVASGDDLEGPRAR
jgi:cobalt-zinc-cadmium efflux system outer membrane protein